MNELNKNTKSDVLNVIFKNNINSNFSSLELLDRDLKLFNFTYNKGRENGTLGNCLSDYNDWLIEFYKKHGL